MSKHVACTTQHTTQHTKQHTTYRASKLDSSAVLHDKHPVAVRNGVNAVGYGKHSAVVKLFTNGSCVCAAGHSPNTSEMWAASAHSKQTTAP